MTATRFDVFSLFPSMFDGPMSESILKRAVAANKIEIHVHDIRDWSTDRHKTADDRPYGGGPGMVMMAPPIVEAVESIVGDDIDETRLFVMSPRGEQFTQSMARDLSQCARIALICGHYEGIDERVLELLPTAELSIGDFVLTGGELPAMVVMDAVARLVPGVILEESTKTESHESGTLEHPHYTRPAEYRDKRVPEVLLSGHHENVEKWRMEQSKPIRKS